MPCGKTYNFIFSSFIHWIPCGSFLNSELNIFPIIEWIEGEHDGDSFIEFLAVYIWIPHFFMHWIECTEEERLDIVQLLSIAVNFETYAINLEIYL